MADIILKDAGGEDITYPGVKTVVLNTTDGGTQTYSEGDVIEITGPIELNFSEGDQTLNAPEGMLVKSAVIKKPETLIPENIVKDIEIAGIIGTNEGGSGSSSEVDIFPLQTVSGFQEDTEILIGIYFKLSPIVFEIKEGETYYVEWDGETYTCKGTAANVLEQSWVYLGNGELHGYPGNNEPFAICYSITGNFTQFLSDNNDEIHDIRVYQKAQRVIVKPLTVTENGTYTALDGEAYSPVTVNVASSGSVSMPLGYELKEIVPETTLTFAVGNSTLLPNTPTAILADSTAITDMDYIRDNESGLVVWDGALYAVYAGSRTSPLLQTSWGTTTMTILGSVGNIGIPSSWYGITVVADTKKCGSSKEPFLIVANTTNGFQVAIPEDSTDFTHTLQMFKFVLPTA